MNRYILITAVFLFAFALDAVAQTPKQVSVQLRTWVRNTPPYGITLTWQRQPDVKTGKYTILRKSATDIEYQGYDEVPFSDTAYTDNDVLPGVAYEYCVFASIPVQNATAPTFGYVASGINVPTQPFKGNVLLVVDATLAPALSTEVGTLKDDLLREGWNVTIAQAPRTPLFTPNAVVATKQIIRDWYGDLGKDTSRGWVFLIGRIAVPYSGMFNNGGAITPPDGHTPDHRGAWAADVFYSYMNSDADWTDKLTDTAASRPETRNRPGDGKYDNAIIPDFIQLRIGRVDMFNMGKFYTVKKQGSDVIDSLASEIALIKNYLKRNHEYRTGALQTKRRGLIDDNFGGYGEQFARSAWMNYSVLLGAENIKEADWMTTLDTADYEWAYGCGGGTYTSAGGVGTSDDFARKNLRNVFSMLFGSYFGDWDNANNFLRAPLASPTPSLINCWAGRPIWYFHGLAMGETMGDAFLRSVNTPDRFNRTFGFYFVHNALHGDPTLRMNYGTVPPPTNLTVEQKRDTKGSFVELNWQRPVSDTTAYFVYKRINGVTTALTQRAIKETTFRDDVIQEADVTYIVRSAGYINSLTGIYQDISTPLEQTRRITSVEENTGADMQIAVEPNPLRSTSRVRFQLQEPTPVRMEITSLRGERVYETPATVLDAGDHSFMWNGSTMAKTRVASGIYTVTLHCGTKIVTTKLIVE
ncbi:MAG: T9SS type A sorting domain-containing protein [Candidatus Kapabacteria bacterium]|nr:T9SS type A sorting domain-containing protein [Candidatus Kapabacteria bacterium]